MYHAADTRIFQIPFNRFYPIKYEQITAILHKPPTMKLYSLGIYPDNQIPGIHCKRLYSWGGVANLL